MKEESARLWQAALTPFPRIHLYTADPGADAMVGEVEPLIRSMGRLGDWFAEGWSAAKRPTCRPGSAIDEGAIGPGETLMVGSQTNYARTRAIFERMAQSGSRAIFIFDHWKNFAPPFGGAALPELIVVPDDLAQRLLLEAIGADVAPRIRVLPHLALEAAVARVLALAPSASAGIVALLLDPTEMSDNIGYDWRSTLHAAADVARQRRIERIFVKPHPRQDASVVEEVVRFWRERGVDYQLYRGETEPLIAMADEVWGMTTIALIVALRAGKPIRSFQVGRTAAGKLASNAYIEPYVVL
jgi:hypothetical protein